MEVISAIVMFIFGNMSDSEHRMTQYVPMESLSSCMKEVRILKKKETDYTKDAFCGPALVELSDDGEILTLHTELPEGAKMIRKKISKEAFERWTLRAKGHGVNDVKYREYKEITAGHRTLAQRRGEAQR